MQETKPLLSKVDDLLLKRKKMFNHKTFIQLDLEHSLKFFRILLFLKASLFPFLHVVEGK